MQPDEVKWHLMIASCYRRSGNYHRALETYKSIHRRFPENVECLKFLVKLSSDMGLREAQEYAMELKKAEKAREIRDQRANSSNSRPGSRRSSSRTSMNSMRTGSGVSKLSQKDLYGLTRYVILSFRSATTLPVLELFLLGEAAEAILVLPGLISLRTATRKVMAITGPRPRKWTPVTATPWDRCLRGPRPPGASTRP